MIETHPPRAQQYVLPKSISSLEAPGGETPYKVHRFREETWVPSHT